MLTSETIDGICSDPDFGDILPPLSVDAIHLLELSDLEQGSPRILALVANKNPLYLARLITFASSNDFGHVSATRSAGKAVERMGTEKAYRLLVSCSMVLSMAEHHATRRHSEFLYKYTLSLSRTVQNLAKWGNRSEDSTAALWLSSLLYCSGIFMGLAYDGKRGTRFGQGLTRLMRDSSFDLKGEEELVGFLPLNVAVALKWEAPAEVVAILEDVATGSPQQPMGKLLDAATMLVSLKSRNSDYSGVLAELVREGLLPPEPRDAVGVSIVGSFS